LSLEKSTLFVDRTAVAADAYHLTGADPAGESLRYVLRHVVANDAIDLVHAHGTGTVTNDPVELAAIAAVAGDRSPAIYSHKAAMGHTQGAAGMLGVALNCLMHQKGIVLPNSNTSHALEHEGLEISRTWRERNIRQSIVLAAGFGGPIAAVSLKSSD
jgi:3-oxoacyl-(acyl-carrier-protein) synthase